MRKYLLGYSVWDKQDMIVEIMEGIRDNISPERVELFFIFDGCTDNSIDVFNKNYDIVLSNFIKRTQINITEKFEAQCHNIFLDYLLTKELSAAIIFQDDVFIKQPTLLSDIDKILDMYGDKIGVIGGRDGFEKMFKDSTGSHWSEPKDIRIKNLNMGEYVAVKMINFGPVIYPISTVKKVGLLDVNTFKFFYLDIDYSLRCSKQDLKNVVMGTEMEHKKYGKYSESSVYNNSIGRIDLDSFNTKISQGYY